MANIEKAATYYAEFQALALELCKAIKSLHGNMKLEVRRDIAESDQVTDQDKLDYEIIANVVCCAVEKGFHERLDPYVERLEQLDLAIRSNLPKPPGSIILPGDDVN